MIRRFFRRLLDMGQDPVMAAWDKARYDAAGFQIDNELGGVELDEKTATTEQRVAVLEANARAAHLKVALVGHYWVTVSSPRFQEARVFVRHLRAARGRWYDADTLLAIADEIRRQQKLLEKERLHIEIKAEDRASEPFEQLARETARALRRNRERENNEAIARDLLRPRMARKFPPMSVPDLDTDLSGPSQTTPAEAAGGPGDGSLEVDR